MMPINPYIAGNPVGGTPNFVGRADVLREVLRVLRHPVQNAIVLYGQRRIGKTSILQQLAAQLPNEGPYHSVYFDLQDKAAWPLGRVLLEIARTVAYALNQPDPDTSPGSAQGLGDNPVKAFRETWLPAALDALSEQTQTQTPSVKHSLVLLFDEFDVLADPKGGQAGADLFPYLRDLMTLDPARLQFVFVIGRKIEDLESIALSLFKGAPSLRVSLLNKTDTIQLARLSEQNKTLHWSVEAIEKIWDLTHGHPFLTQQLCSRIWENLYDEDPSSAPAVTPEDVEQAVVETLEASRNTMEWLWDGLPPAERVVIATLAGAGNRAITQAQLEQLLRESGVRVVIRELQNAPQLLQEWDLIEPVDGGFKFRVELLRRWIVNHKPLSRVQEELDHIEPLAENLYQAANGYFRSNQMEDAIPLLRQAIGMNPNHARSRQLLAEILMLQGEVTEAIQILRFLFDTQPSLARPRLVQALLLKAEDEEDETARINLYRQVLAVDPRHPEALKLVTEFEQAERTRALESQLEKLQVIEKEKRYSEALELAKKLSDEFPKERDWKPDLEQLERKTKLAEDYQRALGALQSGDREMAMRGFVGVLTLEPDYEEATRYLHLARAGQDVVELEDRLRQKEITLQHLNHQVDQETAQRIEAEKQRDEYQIRLENAQNHLVSRQRMIQRVFVWAIIASVLALVFFIGWLLRGVGNYHLNEPLTPIALVQAHIPKNSTNVFETLMSTHILESVIMEGPLPPEIIQKYWLHFWQRL